MGLLHGVRHLTSTHQVDALLKAVEATNIFETEMARRFEGAAPEREPSDPEEFAPGGDDTQVGGD